MCATRFTGAVRRNKDVSSAPLGPAPSLQTNGVIHIIDGVLVPSNFALPAKDILTVAVSVATLSTLVTAVKAANLTEALAYPNGPYT